MKKLKFTIGCFDHCKSRIQRGIFYGNLLTILFAATIILLPLKANSGASPCTNVSGDIEFVGTNNGIEALNFICGGPWFRSGLQQIPFCDPSQPPCTCTFYAAHIDVFSPYGLWTCSVKAPSTEVVLATANFCVEKGDTKVNLVFDQNANNVSLSVDKPSPPCHSSVSSFLGDNPKQEKSKRDKDEFLFDGRDGDEVTLRLESDPREGNNGGTASLAISGNSLDESTSGALPLELDVTLPADGKYSIIVEQPRRPKDQRFRGAYILDVESATGVGLIEPTNNVEK
jgi:hypothetical protein